MGGPHLQKTNPVRIVLIILEGLFCKSYFLIAN
jgi:hypothetical protein